MSEEYSGADLREAARKLGLSQKEIARATGLSVRTVNRMFNAKSRLDARPATIEAVSRVVGLRPPPRRDTGPLLAIELPLRVASQGDGTHTGIRTLLQMVGHTRERSAILNRMTAQYHERMSVVSLRDGELYFEWIGQGIRWSGGHIAGTRAQDLPDTAVAHVAVERYWRALLTGSPVLQYVKTPLGLEFTALTVATDPTSQPGLISITALGRPPLAGVPGNSPE